MLGEGNGKGKHYLILLYCGTLYRQNYASDVHFTL